MPAPKGNGNAIKHGLYLSNRSLKRIDGRRKLARTLKKVHGTLQDALGGDLSPQQLILLDRVVYLVYRVTVFESLYLNGNANPQADDVYLAWVNTLRRTLETLGLKRIPKEAKTLAAYIEETYGKEDPEHN